MLLLLLLCCYWIYWLVCDIMTGIGPSPSGKALGFGPSIRRFESCRSSQSSISPPERLFWLGFGPNGANPAGPAILLSIPYMEVLLSLA